jgi:hypothetical protein
VCFCSVVFSVLAAAQTAAAVALRKSFNGSSWSEQDFFFCLTAGRSEVVTCRGAFTLLGGINTFIAQQKTKKLPVLEACLPYAPDENAAGAAPCSRSCSTTLQDLKYGDFQSQRLISIPQMQRHIRDHGSIVCSWQLFSNVKPFFRQSKDGVYMGPGGARGAGRPETLGDLGRGVCRSQPRGHGAGRRGGTCTREGGALAAARRLDPPRLWGIRECKGQSAGNGGDILGFTCHMHVISSNPCIGFPS